MERDTGSAHLLIHVCQLLCVLQFADEQISDRPCAADGPAAVWEREQRHGSECDRAKCSEEKRIRRRIRFPTAGMARIFVLHKTPLSHGLSVEILKYGGLSVLPSSTVPVLVLLATVFV